MTKKIKHKKNNASSEDMLSSISKLSKVTKEKRFVWIEKQLIFLIIAVLAIVACIIFLVSNGKGHKPKRTSQAQITLSNEVESELANNLAKLSAMQQQVMPIQPRLQNNSLGDTKEYLARQNAPTTMYSATIAGSNTTKYPLKNTNTFVGKDIYSRFGNQAGISTAVEAQRIAHPRYTIANGEFIHAVLETAINSNLPGQLRAVISEPVYAYVGEKPLIPAGSRLIGQYATAAMQGQNRIFVIWNRIILPNGITVQLNSPGVDAIGQAGLGADSVDTHFFARFGESILLSIISAGVANVGVSGNDQYNSASGYRMAISQSVQRSANKALKNSSQTQPTLRVFQGAAINVFVAHDLDFYREDYG